MNASACDSSVASLAISRDAHDDDVRLADPEERCLLGSYSLGHVMNDLCAASWFSYMLVFFEDVAQLSSLKAGGLVLLGQVVDALATPVIGYVCDHVVERRHAEGSPARHRLPIHLVGCIAVACAFPFLFLEQVGPSLGIARHGLGIFMWYGTYVAIFQTGWAMTQISHLAMIPDLSRGSEKRRTALTSVRYAATVIATILVYCVAWVLFSSGDTQSESKAPMGDIAPEDAVPMDPLGDAAGPGKVGPEDRDNFRTLVLCIVALGGVCTVLFHFGLRRVIKSDNFVSNDSISRRQSTSQAAWKWLRTPEFYALAFMYMCTRLLVNVTQTYLALYLLNTLDMHKTAIAETPLVLYACSMLGTLIVNKLVAKIGASAVYTIALIGCALSAGILYIIPQSSSWVVFPAAGLFGLFSSLLMVSCLSMVASLIGKKSGGAFVYGSFSFTDKLSSGAAIMAIQVLHSNSNDPGHFYRLVVGCVPCFVAVLCLISLLVRRLFSLSKAKSTAKESAHLLRLNKKAHLVESTVNEGGDDDEDDDED